LPPAPAQVRLTTLPYSAATVSTRAIPALSCNSAGVFRYAFATSPGVRWRQRSDEGGSDATGQQLSVRRVQDGLPRSATVRPAQPPRAPRAVSTATGECPDAAGAVERLHGNHSGRDSP